MSDALDRADVEPGEITTDDVAARVEADWNERDRPMRENWKVGDPREPKETAPKDTSGKEILAGIEGGLQALLEIEERRTKSRAENERDQVLDAAIEHYDAGEEPGAIANALLQYDESLAREFVAVWEQEEEPDYGEDIAETPSDWYVGLQRRATLQRETEKMRAERDAHEAALEVNEQKKHAVLGEFKRLSGTRGFREIFPTLMELAGPTIEQAEDAEAVRMGVELAYSAAVELQRAMRTAEVQTELQEAVERDNDNWLNGSGKDFDRDAAFQRNLARSLSIDRLGPLKTRRDQVAEIQASVEPDERQRRIDDGFAGIESMDLEGRRKEDLAHKKGWR